MSADHNATTYFLEDCFSGIAYFCQGLPSLAIMSKAVSNASMDLIFEEDRIDIYTVAQLKSFCKRFKVPARGLTKRGDFQKALRAWLESKKPTEHLVEEEENTDRQFNGPVDLTGGRMPSRSGSSVSSKGPSPEELQDREWSRAHEMELAKLKLALEKKKLNMEHDRSLRELEIKARSLEISPSGGSTPSMPVEARVYIPKDVVKEFFKGDDIGQWFKAYEVAMSSHPVPEKVWGAGLWGGSLEKGGIPC